MLEIVGLRVCGRLLVVGGRRTVGVWCSGALVLWGIGIWWWSGGCRELSGEEAEEGFCVVAAWEHRFVEGAGRDVEELEGEALDHRA